MQSKDFYLTRCRKTKDFTQQEIYTGNDTGFGSPADMEHGIDLNEELIRNKPATFLCV